MACVRQARNDTPPTSEPRVSDMYSMTFLALMPSGGRNALTPLEIASSPVSEEPPLANERASASSTTKAAALDTWVTGTVPCCAATS